MFSFKHICSVLLVVNYAGDKYIHTPVIRNHIHISLKPVPRLARFGKPGNEASICIGYMVAK